MKPVNHANSFGVNILGLHIPKYSIYGTVQTSSGSLTYYTTDLASVDDFKSTTIKVHICIHGSDFVSKSVKKNSPLGELILKYADENIPYGTRCICPRKAHIAAPKEKLPQTVFLSKVSNQESIDSRGYANKLRHKKDSKGDIIANAYEQVDFVDKGAYNGWVSY